MAGVELATVRVYRPTGLDVDEDVIMPGADRQFLETY